MASSRKRRTASKKGGLALWVLSVFARAVFPDRRLKPRAAAILEARLRRPADSIAQGSPTRAAAKATYRFIENPRVKPHMLWRPLHEQTARELRSHDWVFAVSDTTALMFPTLKATKGLGTMNTAKREALLMHSVLALRPNGRPIGLLHNEVWARPPKQLGKAKARKSRPFEDKESFKWVRAHRHVRALRRRFSPKTRLVVLEDREADIYEVFADLLAEGDEAIIRCTRDRPIEGPHRTAWGALDAQPVIARLEMEVPRKPGHPKRWARVQVRATRVRLRPPADRPKLPSLSLGLVWVCEPHPPAGVEPLSWRLWTTWPVDTVEECLAVLDAYRLRWRIEDLHRTLKDGCRIERCQFKRAERIKIHLAFCSATAARLLQITHWARTDPQAPCTEFLTDDEWHVLWLQTYGTAPTAEQRPPTAMEAVRMIGRLGGHLGRKCDGAPGVRSLWKGWRDLQLLVEFHRKLRALDPPPG